MQCEHNSNPSLGSVDDIQHDVKINCNNSLKINQMWWGATVPHDVKKSFSYWKQMCLFAANAFAFVCAVQQNCKRKVKTQ